MLVSSVTLAATILTPGFSDQAGDIGLRVAEPERLLTPLLAEFLQLPVRQVSPKGIGRDFIRGFTVRARGFIHGAQQIVRDMQVVLGGHAALCSKGAAYGSGWRPCWRGGFPPDTRCLPFGWFAAVSPIVRKRAYNLHGRDADTHNLPNQAHEVGRVVLAIRVGLARHLVLVDDPLQGRPRPQPVFEGMVDWAGILRQLQ